MYTVGQVAKALQISDSAVRQWSVEFADFLSDSAVPAKGQTRQYSDSDVSVLATVAVMRKQLTDFDAIHQALEEGTRHEPLRPPEAPETAQKAPQEGELLPAIGDAFTTALEAYKGELKTVREELYQERAARIEALERAHSAENRATKAETELEILRKLYQEEAQSTGQEEQRRSWWDKLLGR